MRQSIDPKRKIIYFICTLLLFSRAAWAQHDQRPFSLTEAQSPPSIQGDAMVGGRFIGNLTPDVLDQIVLDGVPLSHAEYDLIMSNIGYLRCDGWRASATLGRNNAELLTSAHVFIDHRGLSKLDAGDTCKFSPKLKRNHTTFINFSAVSIKTGGYANEFKVGTAWGDLATAELATPIANFSAIAFSQKPVEPGTDVLLVTPYYEENTYGGRFTPELAFAQVGTVSDQGRYRLIYGDKEYGFLVEHIVSYGGYSGSPLYKREKGILVLAGILSNGSAGNFMTKASVAGTEFSEVIMDKFDEIVIFPLLKE